MAVEFAGIESLGGQSPSSVFVLEEKDGKCEIVEKPLTEAIYALNSRAWESETLGGTREQIESRLRVFPAGQFVGFVRINDKEVLIGTLHTLRLSCKNPKDFLRRFSTYDGSTANGMFTNHDPAGNALACVSIVADPLFRKHFRGESGYRDCMVTHRLIADGHKFAERHRIKYVFPFSRDEPYARNFHLRRSRFKPPAKLVGELPNARPADKKANGRNVIFQYPTSQTSRRR